jgi:cell fate (sporulation/competence/biofilm development) regulator YlbF (YheA/YmcA/DUF963 family)
MPLTATDSDVIRKTRELCETILNQPEFIELRRNIDSFMSNDSAKEDYQNLLEKSDMLNHKQQQGLRLTQDEIAEYESHRDKVVNNPVSAAFIKAQQEVHDIQESVNKYLSKTFELGRVPSAEELEGGGCGTGCGCH